MKTRKERNNNIGIVKSFKPYNNNICIILEEIKLSHDDRFNFYKVLINNNIFSIHKSAIKKL
jgi:hypothetical protein